MCGICGVYNLDGKPVDPILLKNMTEVLYHRGPDDSGYYLSGGVGLGFRRLSIIDLTGGHQPIFNEDGSCAIIFNGEIYNYRELRSLLISKGHRFTTRSDTEVILHLYEEKGEACVEDLRGMFAFAIWDGRKRRLLLARDRLGIKPLYYCVKGSTCIFGSELKSIIQHPSLSGELDAEALSDYLSFIYIPAPKTIFSEIKKLRPGHIFVFGPERVEERIYWDVSFDRVVRAPEEQTAEKLYQAVSEAVELRLISDVPLGAFLSGGIDSSSVVGVMAQLTSEPVKTNSIGFLEDEYNELDYARQVAALFKTEHHEYVVEPEAVEVVDKLTWHYDEPFADSSAIPTYYVSKMARENVTVALTGDGGDENFAGYRRYFYDRFENRVRARIPRVVRKNLFGALSSLYPKADWAPRIFRGKTLLKNLSLEPEMAYFNSVSCFKEEDKQKLLRPELRAAIKGYSSFSVFDGHLRKVSHLPPLTKIQYLDFKTYLADDILAKVDRASMAVSLEARVPLLDHKLVEFVATIPEELKLNGRTGKYIFKKAMSRLLPPSIINRRKMGFAIPLDRWFRHDLRELAADLLFEANSAVEIYFDRRAVKAIWDQHQSGMRDHSAKLWTLLMFELWHRKFQRSARHRQLSPAYSSLP